jgi:UDP-glucose 4-epimerase
VQKFIFSSSATVYSGSNNMPLTEDSDTGNCINPYGWTKVMCEQILRDIAVANNNWSVVLLRYFNPIGAHESGEIGEDPQGIPNNLMPFIVQTAIGKRDYLSIYGNNYDTPDGTCIRDYIHVTDLAEGHAAAIKYIEKNKGSNIFNLGTGKGTSVLEMVNKFEATTGVKIAQKTAGRRPGDLAVSYTDISKAAQELNWKAIKTVEDACIDSWCWQSQNPNGYDS